MTLIYDPIYAEAEKLGVGSRHPRHAQYLARARHIRFGDILGSSLLCVPGWHPAAIYQHRLPGPDSSFSQTETRISRKLAPLGYLITSIDWTNTGRNAGNTKCRCSRKSPAILSGTQRCISASSPASRNLRPPLIMSAPNISSTLRTFRTGTTSSRRTCTICANHRQLSDDAKEKILYKNAKELFAL